MVERIEEVFADIELDVVWPPDLGLEAATVAIIKMLHNMGKESYPREDIERYLIQRLKEESPFFSGTVRDNTFLSMSGLIVP